MTHETIHLIELGDITRIHLECMACHSSVIRPLDAKPLDFKQSCPNCGSTVLERTDNEAVYHLVTAIANVVAFEGNRKVKVRLQLSGPCHEEIER
jgi:predicted RNA-binding Zn-ribbon protein involved in translation (DUF1610 family)